MIYSRWVTFTKMSCFCSGEMFPSNMFLIIFMMFCMVVKICFSA